MSDLKTRCLVNASGAFLTECFSKVQNVLWVELISTGNGYAFAKDENGAPYVYADYQEALSDHLEDKKHHNELVEQGELDGEYEWELTPVHIHDEIMEILDPKDHLSVIASFNWKKS